MTTISSGSTHTISSGNEISDVVSSGGVLVILPNGDATATIDQGLVLNEGGLVIATQVRSGGSLSIDSGGVGENALPRQ
jgi:autotransporter passenger strand-loop-strand repeat protein